MNKVLILCVLTFPLSVSFADQQRVEADPWHGWQFLLGEWTAEGRGKPGQGTGTFSFNFDLQRKILVRKNRAEYPATKDRPAYLHEDLMVIYPEAGGKITRAIYFDNEGHVIHYTATISEDQKTLSFLSDPLPSTPRFRLTYSRGNNGPLTVKFAVAPPDKPDSFLTYLEGVARRKEVQ